MAAPGKAASGGGGGQGSGAACAACKYQRRRCTAECPLAQYFPHDQPRVFRNAHRLFGVSNILKTLARAGPERRRDAMRAIIFESHAWDAYPAHGCVPVILALQQQLLHAQRQLHLLNARIHAYRAALGPLPLDADGDGDPSSPAPPPPGTTDHFAYGYGGASSSFYDEQQQLVMMNAAASACDNNNGVAAAASGQAPWMMMPPQYDMATTSNIVADMAGVVPQLQHHQQDHQFLVDGATTMLPHSSSSSQQQQQQLYCNSVPIPPEPYDDEMSSYLVDNINEKMPPHEYSTDSSERKAVKAPKMEFSANGPKDVAGCFVGTSSTRFS